MLLVLLIIQYVRRPFRLDDHAVLIQGEQVTLPQRVDPNTATAAELARIPHLGEATAAKIIAYREARIATAADGIVFRRQDDLDNIPGVGKALIEQFAPFLEFPGIPIQP
jgi:DNA uptake protein ComE-like DNA-binding protein